MRSDLAGKRESRGFVLSGAILDVNDENGIENITIRKIIDNLYEF